MTQQQSLFDYSPPPKIRHDHPETSFQAAKAVAPVTGKLRQMVYTFAVQRGTYGFTDQELFLAFPDRSENSLRPRRIELVDAGRIIDNGQRRKNARGRECIVWIIP